MRKLNFMCKIGSFNVTAQIKQETAVYGPTSRGSSWFKNPQCTPFISPTANNFHNKCMWGDEELTDSIPCINLGGKSFNESQIIIHIGLKKIFRT